MSNKKEIKTSDKLEKKALKEVSIEKIVDEATRENAEFFLKEMLVKSVEEIENLKKIIAEMSKIEIQFRDEVALQCYPILIKESADYNLAAIDAYRAADIFMRAREGNEIEHMFEKSDMETNK